jgi:hypothetical protein
MIRPGIGHRKKTVADLKAWFHEKGGLEEQWNDDRKMLEWLSEKGDAFKEYIRLREVDIAAEHISDALSKTEDAALRRICVNLKVADKKRILDAVLEDSAIIHK